MAANNNISTKEWQLVGQLLRPSFTSAVVGIVAGLIVTVGVIVAFAFQNSSVQKQLIQWEGKQPQKALTTPDEILPENDRPTLTGSWPLLVLWAGVGLAVYGVALAVVRSVGTATSLIAETRYVNSKASQKIESAVGHLILRLVSLIVFISLTVVLIKQVVPYAISNAQASSYALTTPHGILYAVLGFAIIVVTTHVQTIFLRLSFGKARVF